MKAHKLKRAVSHFLLSVLLLSPWLGAIADQIPAKNYIPYTGQQVAHRGIGSHTNISKFGENPDIDTADGFEPIWDGATSYTVPTIPRMHDLASTSVEDAGTVLSNGTATSGSANTLVDSSATFQSDGVSAGDFVLNDNHFALGRVLSVPSETTIVVARMLDPQNGIDLFTNELGDSYRVVTSNGTGAGLVSIQGLDSFRSLLNEFVVLNGTSNVATIGTYSRQYRMRAFVMGSAIGAVGVVTSTAQTDATVTMQLINGNNQSLTAIYSVPLGKMAYITRWKAALSKDVGGAVIAIVRLRVGELDNASYVTEITSLSRDGTSSFNVPFDVPVALPGGVDVWIEASSSANNTGISGGFEMFIVDN